MSRACCYNVTFQECSQKKVPTNFPRIFFPDFFRIFAGINLKKTGSFPIYFCFVILMLKIKAKKFILVRNED